MKWNDDLEEDTCYYPEQVSCVIIDGEYVPIHNVEFLNIEEDFTGRDLVTFIFLGKERKSYIVNRYI